jgi:hypothetical protein
VTGALFAWRPSPPSPGDGAALPPLTPPAPRPAAPPVEPGGRLRRYYRCTDCLDSFATVERATGCRCGACGGPIEYVGDVRRQLVVRPEQRCACDERCTGATGPHCDCRCGGVNHGTGRTVEVDRVVGRVVGQLAPAKCRARAEEYRAALAAARDHVATLGRDTPAAWRARRAIDAAEESRSHAHRMKVLRGIAGGPR